jgi:hypothetical protein
MGVTQKLEDPRYQASKVQPAPHRANGHQSDIASPMQGLGLSRNTLFSGVSSCYPDPSPNRKIGVIMIHYNLRPTVMTSLSILSVHSYCNELYVAQSGTGPLDR